MIECNYGLVIRFIGFLDTSCDYTLQFSVVHTLVSTVTTAVAWYRTPIADIPLSPGSWLQLPASNRAANNDWTTVILELAHKKLNFKLKLFCDRPPVRQSIMESDPHLGPTTRFLLLPDICGLHIVRRPPWREDGSVMYNSLSLLGPSLIWDWVPFLSPLMTRRATGRGMPPSQSQSQSHITTDSQSAVRRQSGTHDQFFHLLQIFF
jgi:hypothetical protein